MGGSYVKTQNADSAKGVRSHRGDWSPGGWGGAPAGLWRPCVASATFFPL